MFAALLSRLGDAFDRAGIPYMVIGGQSIESDADPVVAFQHILDSVRRP